MLVSHIHQFIYLKTRKTAGTSVEILFEPFCTPPDEPRGIHSRRDSYTKYGIVGARGSDAIGATFYNHMSAKSLQDIIGEKIFNQYFKWCIVRHPMDRQVSWWWFRMDQVKREYLRNESDFETVRRSFKSDLMSNTDPLPSDKDIYCISNYPVVDFFVRYENLATELLYVANKIGVTVSLSELGRYKTESRARAESYLQYFNDYESVAYIKGKFSWEFQYFNYR